MTGHFRAIVIGASAGALDALAEILPLLPEKFPLSVAVVVHLPPDKKSIMASLLQAKCRLTVKEAEDKEIMENSTVYLAPPDYHLLIEANGYLSLSSDEPVMYSRPSIDILFESAADAFGPEVIGVILTGANSDGARGLKAIGQGGGIALVQRPDMAYAAAMPLAALENCSEAQALSLDQIAKYLQKAAAL